MVPSLAGRVTAFSGIYENRSLYMMTSGTVNRLIPLYSSQYIDLW
jgi:hypothetical protein